MRLAILTSHPIQYQAPLFRELAQQLELEVFFAHRQTASQQAQAGYGVAFEWDIDLLAGYSSTFLSNRSRHPRIDRFWGCDTPEIFTRIRHGHFDALLVSGWNLLSFWQAILACKLTGTPVLVRGDSQLLTPRSRLKSGLKAVLYPLLLRQFDAALYVGQRNREYLRRYGIPEERLFFAPHCVDNAYFRTIAAQSNRNHLRTTWNVDDNTKVILFVGRLIGLKRCHDLINALHMLHKQGQHVVGVFVGVGEEQPKLLQLAEELTLPIRLLGFRNQSLLPSIYQAADVLVLPSASETWGLVVNEALAAGTPCVVSDACGCTPDLIVSGVTGETFAMGDSADLARALLASFAIPRDTPALQAKIAAYSVQEAAAGIVRACRWCIARYST